MSEPVTPSRRLRPRTVTLLLACAVVLLVGLAGATVPVPWVALGPGPTFNTLDSKDGTPVVSVEGLPTFPTSGHLNMTTVSVTDGLTMFQTLGVWVDPNEQVVPRNAVFAPGRTQEQIDAKNTQDFSDSESSAVSAALNYLKLPPVSSPGVSRSTTARENISPADGPPTPLSEMVILSSGEAGLATGAIPSPPWVEPGSATRVTVTSCGASPRTIRTGTCWPGVVPVSAVRISSMRVMSCPATATIWSPGCSTGCVGRLAGVAPTNTRTGSFR